MVAPTFKTNDQSPFLNLFQNVTTKFWIRMKKPTLRQGEKVVTKAIPTLSTIRILGFSNDSS
jgi:hypothetical protein